MIVCTTKHCDYQNFFGIVSSTFNEGKNLKKPVQTKKWNQSVLIIYCRGFMASDIWRDTFFPSSLIYSCTPSDPSSAQLVFLQRISVTVTRTALKRDGVVPSKTVLLNFRPKQSNKWIVAFLCFEFLNFLLLS